MRGRGLTLVGILAVLLALLAGCATMSDVMKSKDEGTAQVYPVNTEQAWEISNKRNRDSDCFP